MDDKWQCPLWKPDTLIFHTVYERLKQDRNRLGKLDKHNEYHSLNFALGGWLKYHTLLCYTSSLQIRVILCHLIVWKVVLTHLWAGQLYLVRANIASWAKYWSSVQNIDSAQLVEWGDEGSFEGTMTQLEGNPKNPDPSQFIILPAPCCSLVASLGAQCSAIHWMGQHIVQHISVFWKKHSYVAIEGWSGHIMDMLGRVYCAPPTSPHLPFKCQQMASLQYHTVPSLHRHLCRSLCAKYTVMQYWE